MIDLAKLTAALEANTQKAVQAFEAFPDERFHQHPANGWSAANIGEHLAASEGVINRLVIDGPTIPTDRDPLEKVPRVYSEFLDFDRKFPSPGYLAPKKDEIAKATILQDFQKYRDELTKFMQEADLTLVCKGGKHPLFGTLTRVGWIHFNIVHVDRHLYQLNGLLNGD